MNNKQQAKEKSLFSSHNFVIFLVVVLLIIIMAIFEYLVYLKYRKILSPFAIVNSFIFGLIAIFSIYMAIREFQVRRNPYKNKPLPFNGFTAILLFLYGFFNFVTYFIRADFFSDTTYFYFYQYLALLGNSFPDFLLVSYFLSRLVFTHDSQKTRFTVYVMITALIGWLTYFSRYFTVPKFLALQDIQNRLINEKFKDTITLFFWDPLLKDLSLLYVFLIIITISSFFLFRHICQKREKTEQTVIDYFLLRLVLMFLFVSVVKSYQYASQAYYNILSSSTIFSQLQVIALVFNVILIFVIFEHTHRPLRGRVSLFRKPVKFLSQQLYAHGGYQADPWKKVLFYSVIGLCDILFFVVALFNENCHLAAVSICITLTLLIPIIALSGPLFNCH